MINQFLENRRRIQLSLSNENFIYDLTPNDSTYIIEETNPTAILKEALLTNIPVGPFNNPISWAIDLEKQGSILSTPQGFRKTEKAIAFFTLESLYIVFIELKSKIKALGESGINKDGLEKKIKNSISRIATLLPNYIFGAPYDQILKLKYFAIIAYNNDDELQKQLLEIPETKKYSLSKVFMGLDSQIPLTDNISGFHKVGVFFIKNQNNNDSIEINLDEIFQDDHEFPNAQYTNVICPKN